MIIRRATLLDMDDVWPLAHDFATSFEPRRDAFDVTFASVIDDDNALVVLAIDDAAVVGYLLAHIHRTFLANAPVVWVEEVIVAEPSRRRGIGASLMRAAEDWADERGAAYVSLASRRAGDFYLALGYDDSATFFKKAMRVIKTAGGTPPGT